MKDNILLGPHFFLQGLRLLLYPKIRRYIIVPLIVNVFLVAAIMIGIALYLNSHVITMIAHYPKWLLFFLGSLFWIFYLIISWLVGGFVFTMLTNLIASPFYGLLSEAVEERIEGELKRPHSMNFLELWYHTFIRECRKILYFIPWLLLCLLLLPFPVLWAFFPFVFWVILSWIFAVQYCDYAADNQQIPLKSLISTLQKNPLTALSFGGTITIALAIPGFNLIVPAAAVAGGTALFLEFKVQWSQIIPIMKKL